MRILDRPPLLHIRTPARQPHLIGSFTYTQHTEADQLLFTSTSLKLHFHFKLHTYNNLEMSYDMDWSPDFCLACDRQTDGAAYCGEACRLAEYEKSYSGSGASSPASQRSSIVWPTTRPANNFYLPPAYDFAAYRSARPQSSTATDSSKPILTPSSSQSSLLSLKSTSSTASSSSEGSQLSEEARQALRAYDSSFDRSRYQRRQSTS